MKWFSSKKNRKLGQVICGTPCTNESFRKMLTFLKLHITLLRNLQLNERLKVRGDLNESSAIQHRCLFDAF